MRLNSDKTMERNYLKVWQSLISEYELVKAKKHPKFKFAEDFYKHYGTKRQNSWKYYHRYLEKASDTSLLPRKRGPRYKTGRALDVIEAKVVELRSLGLSRYNIASILKDTLGDAAPSPSGVYNIMHRHNVNRLTPARKESARKLIREKAGELAHIDCHYCPKGMLSIGEQRLYLVGVIDSCTRLLWLEIVSDIKALTVMFASMRCFHSLLERYGIKFSEVLTDNGSEFGSVREAKNKDTHPFEVLLSEMGIKHLYTRPHRPQTNDKIERFWRTLEEEFMEGSVFDDLASFKKELLMYLIYYNEHRSHQSLDGKTPLEFMQNLSTKC